MGDSNPNQTLIQPCPGDSHWVEFQLFDEDDKPVPGEPYKVRLPDQSVFTGTLDNEGKVRFNNIVAGQATICFTRLDKKEWGPL